MLDKITGRAPIAMYVSPQVEGKVLRNLGDDTHAKARVCQTETPGYTGYGR